MPPTVERHQITVEIVPQVKAWLETRGGIALWASANLSNPGMTWTTPLNDAEGNPKKKESWQMEDKPYRVITDAGEIEVMTPKEVKRFKIATRMGSQGMSIKLTDAASKRVRRECDKAGSKSSYHFEYDECVVTVPDEAVSLADYLAKNQPPGVEANDGNAK